MRRRAVPVVLLAAALGAGTLTGCGSGTGSDTGRIRVVAGENVWGDIVAQIGGDHVTVRSIISDPNTDPHEYESDVQDASAVATADVVVENGLGYDDFLTKLLAASPRSGRDVLSVQKILDVTGPDPNPHIWYDTARIPAVADAVAAELARRDPADAAAFRANAATFVASLTPITDVISEIRLRYAGTEIAYTERVPGYLVAAAGLRLGVPAGFTEAVENGTDPSPGDTAAFDRAVRDRTVRVLLYNGQVTDSQTTAIRQLAAASGVPVVAVTETLPSTDADYQAWQLRQAREILAALGGG